MTAPLSLSTELKQLMRSMPELGFTRMRGDLWQRSLGDVEWRLWLDKEPGWPRAKRTASIGVAVPLLHRYIDGLGLLNEGYGTFGGNLLAIADAERYGPNPAITLADRQPRFALSKAARSTWSVEYFGTEMRHLLTSVALPWWEQFPSLAGTADTLAEHGERLERQGLVRPGDRYRFEAVLRWHEGDPDRAHALLREAGDELSNRTILARLDAQST